jgi:hypothetical protein
MLTDIAKEPPSAAFGYHPPVVVQGDLLVVADFDSWFEHGFLTNHYGLGRVRLKDPDHDYLHSFGDSRGNGPSQIRSEVFGGGRFHSGMVAAEGDLFTLDIEDLAQHGVIELLDDPFYGREVDHHTIAVQGRGFQYHLDAIVMPMQVLALGCVGQVQLMGNANWGFIDGDSVHI